MPQSPPSAQPQQDMASPAYKGGNALPQASHPASANSGEEGQKDEADDGGGGDGLLAEAARESPQPDRALGSWTGFGSTSEGQRATSPAMPIENVETQHQQAQPTQQPRQQQQQQQEPPRAPAPNPQWIQNRHDDEDRDDALPPPSFVIRTILVEEEEEQKQQERQAREEEQDGHSTHTHLCAQAPAGARGRTQSHYDPGSLYYVEESNISTSNPGGAEERQLQEEKERAAETHQQEYHHEHQEANQHHQRSIALAETPEADSQHHEVPHLFTAWSPPDTDGFEEKVKVQVQAKGIEHFTDEEVDANLREIVEQQQREFEQNIAAERAKKEAELAAAQSAEREAEETARIINNNLHEERRKLTPAPPLRTQAGAVTLHAGVDCVIVDLILKMDFSETVGREEEYKSGISADMASAVGCNPNKIRVQVSITRHVIIVGMFASNITKWLL